MDVDSYVKVSVYFLPSRCSYYLVCFVIVVYWDNSSCQEEVILKENVFYSSCLYLLEVFASLSRW